MDLKHIDQVKNELHRLRLELKKFDDLDHNFRYDSQDPEEELEARKINGIIQTINDLEQDINYLNSVVVAEGNLVMNTNGRYEINGHELSSGSTLEVWKERYQEWSEERIEHFHGKYGLYYSKEHDLDGIFARVRRMP